MGRGVGRKELAKERPLLCKAMKNDYSNAY